MSRLNREAVEVQIAVKPSGFVHAVSIVTSADFAAAFEKAMTRQQSAVVRLPGDKVPAWHTAHNYAMLTADAELLARLKAGEVPALSPEQLERYAFLAPKTAPKGFGGIPTRMTSAQGREDGNGAAPALFPECGRLPPLPALDLPAPQAPAPEPPRAAPKLPPGQPSLFD